MKKLLFIALIAIICFMLEYLFFDFFGSWCRPRFVFLFVVFCNLIYGVRYAIVAAVVGGLVKDSFGQHLIGFHIFPLILVAYLGVFLRRSVYSFVGRPFGRFFLSSILLVFYFFCQYILFLTFQSENLFLALRVVFLPEFILTLIVMHVAFESFKKCALKFSVS